MKKQFKYGILILNISLWLAVTCYGGPVIRTVEDNGVTIATFRTDATEVSWSQSGNDLIAYSAPRGDGYYDIHVARSDGSNDIDLTGHNPDLPHKHHGDPSWHPRGRWIVFVAEKEKHPGSSYAARGGFGAYNDIWVMTPDGKEVHQLTNLPADRDHGVIFPHFSPDGRRLMWTQLNKRPSFLLSGHRGIGYWQLQVADFIEGPEGPYLRNVQTFAPGGQAFYEGYGFSPDGRKLIFCSDMKGKTWSDEDIFTIDGQTGGDVQQLTAGDYNEHAFYSPDGSFIVWMTDRDNKARGLAGRRGTDWWIMNADGSGKRRLTYFNQPRHPEYSGDPLWATQLSFHPDAKVFAGELQTSLLKQNGMIKLVSLPNPKNEGR